MIFKIEFLQHLDRPYGIDLPANGRKEIQRRGVLRFYDDGGELFASQDVVTNGTDYFDATSGKQVRT
jgi:hypothetical protein